MTSQKDQNSIPKELSNVSEHFDFGSLIQSIQTVDLQLTRQASRAVNASLTVRNWLIGFYIQEYE